MPRFAANLKFLYTEHAFLDRFEAAAQAGFRGVEYQDPYEHEVGAIRARLDDKDLAMVLMNFPAGDWDAGDRGLACLPGREPEFRGAVARGLDAALALGCPRVNCLAGVAPPGEEPARLHATLVANAGYAAEQAADVGVTVTLEPLNTRDVPGFFLATSRAARAVIAEVGAPNLTLQLDLYHTQVMEGDLARNLEASRDVLGHVQFADNPGRHEPGTGEINFPFVFSVLDRIGYDGWTSAEYTPRTTTRESLAWLHERSGTEQPARQGGAHA